MLPLQCGSALEVCQAFELVVGCRHLYHFFLCMDLLSLSVCWHIVAVLGGTEAGDLEIWLRHLNHAKPSILRRFHLFLISINNLYYLINF